MNIEEFRASVTAKRDLSRRMAVLAEQAGAAKSWHYHRGRTQAYSKVLEMLADVDLNLPDGWQPPPNLERGAGE